MIVIIWIFFKWFLKWKRGGGGGGGRLSGFYGPIVEMAFVFDFVEILCLTIQ